uniref:Uncharacterized protein n=1 Tax=uncultured marine group II/III euryarchaeote KM3_153_G11 TaxID=1457896 RepID=A0A075GFY9_9EURY|nr:hypothetical protein [uncultured marine group II/III euryarchaeote KM3_153_G11]
MLANELSTRTKEGKVAWQETGRKEEYRVYFPDVVLTVSKEEEIWEEAEVEDEFPFVTTYKLNLGSESGRVIDSLKIWPNAEHYELLSEIFENAIARVRDTGINKALDYLIRP